MTLSEFLNSVVTFLNIVLPVWQVALLASVVIGGASLILGLISALRD